MAPQVFRADSIWPIRCRCTSLVTQILHNISPVDGCGYMIQYYCLSNNWDINVKLSVGTHPNPHFRLIPCSGNLASFISKPCLFVFSTILRFGVVIVCQISFVSEAPAVCVSPPLVPQVEQESSQSSPRCPRRHGSGGGVGSRQCRLQMAWPLQIHMQPGFFNCLPPRPWVDCCCISAIVRTSKPSTWTDWWYYSLYSSNGNNTLISCNLHLGYLFIFSFNTY